MENNARENDLTTTAWYKSSYSGGSGGDCLEVARWRKSTYSAGDGGDCLEVADGHPTLVPVRDSKNPLGPVITFGAAAWGTFVGHLGATG
ncbi:DUF397 domain-containing protein [Streptomyces sp. NPDC005251]|uniref:DUF397 domain-containing protein n=1 Tax=Streptomyces sp. NPDC005251 TaxID=3157166 RepID=UPI0033BF1DD4